MSTPIDQKRIEEWAMQLLRSHNVETIRWNDGSIGTLNVPKKWNGIIHDFTVALVELGAGNELPKLLAPRRRGQRRPH